MLAQYHNITVHRDRTFSSERLHLSQQDSRPYKHLEVNKNITKCVTFIPYNNSLNMFWQ